MTNKQNIELDPDLYKDVEPIIRSKGSRTFEGWNNDTSIKSDFTREDYNHFRKSSETKTRAGSVSLCQEAYDKVGIIKNVIDLMSDFGSKGINIRHSDPKIDKYCQTWFKIVSGQERTERFLSSLYKSGSVVIYEKMGRSSEDITSKYIPIQYTFLNPAVIEVDGEDKGIIPSDFKYKIKYSKNTLRLIEEKQIQSVIPEDLKKYKNAESVLPSSRISVYNYKKDDWCFWGNSIIYALLDDLQVLEKLRLSDIAALDGAISSVRLWNVGKITDSPQTTILPTNAQLKKVASMLANGIGGGSMDIVFGPELDFKESSTNIHQFLGEGKYKPTLDSIYDGLGIPSPLRSSNKGNDAGNTVSLKTLVERLHYGRMLVIDFWTKQLKKIFKTLGFKTTEDPIIGFDYMILTDEAAEKKLLLDMVDRDMIDFETVRGRFNIIQDITKRNLIKETSERGNTEPIKAGPFHNANVNDDMKKTMLQAGTALPSEIGLKINVDDKEVQKRFKANQKASKPASTIGKKTFSDTPGRPKNLTETKKRQKKASAIVWASNAQKIISDIYTPVVLSIYKKKNVRSLSSEETNNLENAKAKILLSLDPFSKIDEETILKSIGKKIDLSPLVQLWEDTEKDIGELTIIQKREINSIYYAESLE